MRMKIGLEALKKVVAASVATLSWGRCVWSMVGVRDDGGGYMMRWKKNQGPIWFSLHLPVFVPSSS